MVKAEAACRGSTPLPSAVICWFWVSSPVSVVGLAAVVEGEPADVAAGPGAAGHQVRGPRVRSTMRIWRVTARVRVITRVIW